MNKASNHEKIILALANLNWISNSLNQLYLFYAPNHPLGDEIDRFMSRLSAKLKNDLEFASNYMSNLDGVTMLDERVLSPGNQVVLLGMDEYETDYSAKEDGQDE